MIGIGIGIDPTARSLARRALVGATTASATRWSPDGFPGIGPYAFEGRRPTMFYDPGAAGTSRNLGSFDNPYTTLAQLAAAFSGEQPGQVLGVKRGSVTRGMLALTVHGAAGAPAAIVPYGDALPLPTFSGGVVRADWTVHEGDDRLWQRAGTPDNVDAYLIANGEPFRLLKVASLAALQDYASAPLAGTVGAHAHVGTTLYLRLADGSSPNLGQIELAERDAAIRLRYPDVAGTGHLIVAGMKAILSRNSALTVTGTGATNAPADIAVVGCEAAHTGVDADLGLTGDAILIYGASDAARLTGLYVAGNHAHDCLNNAIEIAGIEGGVVERNLGTNAGGSSIVELWSSCSGVRVTHNRGYGDPLAKLRNLQHYSQSGIWVNNLVGTETTSGPDDSRNGGHLIAFNHVEDPATWGLRHTGCRNVRFLNNTIAQRTLPFEGAYLGYQTSATSTGNEARNTLIVDTVATPHYVRFVDITAQAGKPALSNNGYFLFPAPGNANYTIGGDYPPTGDLEGWQALSGTDAGSKSSTYGTSAAQLAYTPTDRAATGTDYSLGGASALRGAGAAITDLGITRDVDGRAILDPQAPVIGAVQA